MSRRAAQPVVGVNNVGQFLAANQHADRTSKVIHQRDELAHRQRRRRTGRDVVHSEARLNHHGISLRGIVATGVDIDRVALSGERRTHFTNVDVHAAAVAGARLGQRGRVVRENGQASH